MPRLVMIMFLTFSFACLKADAASEEGRAAADDDYTVEESSMTSADSRENILKRKNAAIELGKERDIKNLPALIEMLDDEDPGVQRAVITAMVRLKSAKAALPLIKKFRTSSDVSVKKEIVNALGDIGSRSAVPLMKELLKDDYPSFRSGAVKALGKIDDSGTYPAIINMLKDPSMGVKIETTRVLRKLKLPESAPLLIRNLNDPTPVVRRESARTLGEIGSSSAVNPLEKLMQDSDKSVAAEAKKAYEKIRKPEGRSKGSKK